MFATTGAAIVIEERDLKGDALTNALRELMTDADKRARMSAAASTLARPDAAARIADRVATLVAEVSASAR